MAKMYLEGTDPIDVHPTKVAEMERKGWSLKEPAKGVGKSSLKFKKGESDGDT